MGCIRLRSRRCTFQEEWQHLRRNLGKDRTRCKLRKYHMTRHLRFWYHLQPEELRTAGTVRGTHLLLPSCNALRIIEDRQNRFRRILPEVRKQCKSRMRRQTLLIRNRLECTEGILFRIVCSNR